MPPGAVSCWVFLTCKELLSVCETFKEYLDIEIYSIYTSHLWTCLQSVVSGMGVVKHPTFVDCDMGNMVNFI